MSDSKGDEAGPDAERDVQARISAAIRAGKRSRWAHMAKLHEAHGDFTGAEHHYAILGQTQMEVLGAAHPDVASVTYETARLNYLHEVPHTPDLQPTFDQLGRAGVVNLLYTNALSIRHQALGENDPAVGQCLYGLAGVHLKARDYEKASGYYRRASEILGTLTDPLPMILALLGTLQASASQNQHADVVTYGKLLLFRLRLQPEPLPSLRAESRSPDALAYADTPDDPIERVPELRALHSAIFDPYFTMALELAGNDTIAAMLLPLQRFQYLSEFLDAHITTLRTMASAYQAMNQPGEAMNLLEEAAELQRP